MNYIYKGITHSDTSADYLVNLGMDEEQIESMQNQLDYEVEVNQSKAKAVRDAEINADIEVSGYQWQVDAKGRDNLNEAINKCLRNDLPDTESRSWIMADNIVADVTFADLKQVMDAYAERMDFIYQQYAVWRAGDRKEAFAL